MVVVHLLDHTDGAIRVRLIRGLVRRRRDGNPLPRGGAIRLRGLRHLRGHRLVLLPAQLTQSRGHGVHMVRGGDEFRWLVDFVREGLLDKRARPEQFRKLVPKTVPSGLPTLTFEFNDRPDRK